MTIKTIFFKLLYKIRRLLCSYYVIEVVENAVFNEAREKFSTSMAYGTFSLKHVNHFLVCHNYIIVFNITSRIGNWLQYNDGIISRVKNSIEKSVTLDESFY